MIGKGSAEEKLKYAFKLYDEDQNGSLDRGEIETIIKQMKSVAGSIGRPSCGDFIETLMKKLGKKNLKKKRIQKKNLNIIFLI
jgi:hypothetical protein